MGGENGVEEIGVLSNGEARVLKECSLDAAAKKSLLAVEKEADLPLDLKKKQSLRVPEDDDAEVDDEDDVDEEEGEEDEEEDDEDDDDEDEEEDVSGEEGGSDQEEEGGGGGCRGKRGRGQEEDDEVDQEGAQKPSKR